MGLIYLPERGVQGWFLPDDALYWDKEHPLLKDALIAQALVNGQWVDLLTGRKLNSVGSTATYRSRNMGRVVSTGATSTSNINTGVTPTVTEANIAFLGTLSMDASATGGGIVTSKATTGNGGGVQQASGNVSANFESNDGADLVSGTIPYVFNKLRPFCATADASTVDFYWGGVKATQGTGKTCTATTLSGTQTLSIGRRGTFYTSCSSNLIIARQEKISDRQYEEFVSAPFAMFHQRRIWVPVSGGSTTHSYSGSGSLTFSGTATTTWTQIYSYAGSGSLAFSGSASTAWTSNWTYSGAGTLTFSGTGTTSYTPAGSTTYTYAGSGSLAFSGAATTTWTSLWSYTGSGDLLFSGAGATSYTPGLVVYSYAGSGYIAFSGAATTSGPIVVTEQRVGVGGYQAKQGKARSVKKQKVILIERVEDVEDLVEQIEEVVREETKVKPLLRKAKKQKPETVENTTDNAQAWIDYYQAIASALQDQEKARQVEEALQRGAEMLNAMMERQETAKLMAVVKRRRDEEDFLLMLMAA